jgi:hypothetical protein
MLVAEFGELGLEHYENLLAAKETVHTGVIEGEFVEFPAPENEGQYLDL